MVKISEILKGIAVFFFGNILMYFVYTMLTAFMDFVKADEIYLGTVVWVSFIAMYIFSLVVYPIYAVIVNDSEKNTDPSKIGIAWVWWLLGTCSALLLYWITDAMLSNVIFDSAIHGSYIPSFVWIFVIVAYLGFVVMLPAVSLLEAFDSKEVIEDAR